MKMTRRDFLKLSSAAAAACGVTLLPAQKADAASAIQTLLEEAYLYAFPLVLVDATKTVSTNTKTASASRAPVNQFIHARKLLDASSRTVVSPNVDTIYTQAWLDVSAEPQIYVVPEADRFFNVQVLDAWTNTAAVLEAPGAYAIAYSSWEGTLPEGVRRIDIPTRTVWTIARIMLSGPDDLPNVAALQGRMQLMPLSAYPAGLAAAPEGSYSPENDFVPVQKVLAMTPQEFFDTANRLMETDPPAEADAPLLRSLAALSVGPGQQFDASALGPLGGLRWKRLLLQLKSSLRAQAARYSRQMGQWIYYGDPIGNFGTAYDYRTMVALMGLGANTTDIAISAHLHRQRRGRPYGPKDLHAPLRRPPAHSGQRLLVGDGLRRGQLPHRQPHQPLLRERSFRPPSERRRLGGRHPLQGRARGHYQLAPRLGRKIPPFPPHL